MNSYTHLIVNERMEQLRREAAERHARPAQGATTRRIATALTSLRLAITTPVGSSNPIIPALDGYPYRG